MGFGAKNKTSIKMRKVVLLFCALLCTTVLMAQQQLATLKHNSATTDSISIFYGTNAFVQAYSAAVSGDVITLSDGVFKPCDVCKSITLRGNGALSDTARGVLGTQFFEKMEVYRSSSTAPEVQFEAEGIYFNELRAIYQYNQASVSMKLTRCVINKYKSCDYAHTVAINCILNNTDNESSCYLEADNSTYTNTFINCVLNSGKMPYYSTCTNCIIRGQDYHSSIGSNAYTNCIVINTNSSDTILSRNCTNSILCGFVSTDNIYSQGNVSMNVNDVFENWDGTGVIFKDDIYVLKDSVATTILGLDGTQVGVYGGVMPLDFTPAYNSFIKKCNVANRTTADGKLSVDIEVVTE